MSIYEMIVVLVGSGALVTALKVSFTMGGLRREFYDFKNDTRARLDRLDNLVIYDRVPKLLDAGMLDKNSPLQVKDISHVLDRLGGTMPHFIRAFERIVDEQLPEADTLLLDKLARYVGEEVLEQRADEWARVVSEERGERFTPADYLTLWLVALRQAQREGVDVVLKQMGVKS